MAKETPSLPQEFLEAPYFPMIRVRVAEICFDSTELVFECTRVVPSSTSLAFKTSRINTSIGHLGKDFITIAHDYHIEGMLHEAEEGTRALLGDIITLVDYIYEENNPRKRERELPALVQSAIYNIETLRGLYRLEFTEDEGDKSL